MLNQMSKEALFNHAKTRLSREIHNATGFQIDIDTLTGIKSRVTEQRFYEIAPSDYMPVEVGQDPWAEDRLTYLTFDTSNDFEAGIIETGSNSGRLERTDTQIEGIRVPRKVWAKANDYNIAELAQAQRSGNWSLIEQKESSRFRNWQLGVQRVAFLGLSGSNVNGLLSQPTVNSDLITITKKLSSMTATEFQAFLANVLPSYYANANSTILPDTFVMPTDDFLGLGSAVDETFNIKSRLERLIESFQQMTGNPDFKVMPLAYSQVANNDLGVTRYAMYRRNDATSLTMEIPVDYTTTIYDTVNGFSYNSVGYGQFSGLQSYRPLEMLYFDF